MTAIPKVSAHFTTSLASKITSSATSLTVVSATDKAGNALSGLYGIVVDKGSASEEFMLGTFSGTTFTITARGLDPGDGKTEVSALKLSHRRGATVDITDYPVLAILARILNADETLPNGMTLGGQLDMASHKIVNVTDPTSDQDAATKAYVATVAIAGAADASSTIKGVTKLSLNPVSPTAPIAVGDNDSRVPTAGQAAALPGNNTDIAVGSGNKFMTQTGLQHSAENYAADSSVSANTITVTLAPVPTSYTAGMPIRVKVANAVTGATTINVNSLGAKTIKKYVAGAIADLAANDILANQTVTLAYDSGLGFMILQSPPAVNYPYNTGLGAWGSATADGAGHQVTTDGFLVLFVSGASSGPTIDIYSDSSSTPTTKRASVATVNGAAQSAMIPVRKNDYYKIVVTGTGASTTAFFIPLS